MRSDEYLAALHEPAERGASEDGRDPELVAYYRSWLTARIGTGLLMALLATAVVLGADTLIAAWSGP